MNNFNYNFLNQIVRFGYYYGDIGKSFSGTFLISKQAHRKIYEAMTKSRVKIKKIECHFPGFTENANKRRSKLIIGFLITYTNVTRLFHSITFHTITNVNSQSICVHKENEVENFAGSKFLR